MAKADGAARVLRPPRPTITLPPRSSVENLFAGVPGLSPGPLTLVSNFFSDNYPDSDCCSFSQLLAVAMTSPVAPKVQSLLAENVSREVKLDTGVEQNSGFKQNRPVNLVVAHSPVFMIPSGLSPSGLLNSPGFFSPLQSPFGMTHQQALAQVTAEAELSKRFMHIQAEHQSSSLAPSADCLTHHQPLDSVTTVQQELPTSVQEPESSLMESIELSQYDMKSLPPATVDKPVSDGYNWRKYGQKQVKASEYPRSYYRCTHPNCPVKKKVERNNAGLISEITYKGQHSHGLPQSNKRTKKAAIDVNSNTISQMTPDVGLLGETEMHMTGETFHHPVPGWDQASTQLTPTQLSRSNDHEEMSDTEVKLDEGEISEPSPKRRFTAIGTSELTSSQRTVTEHRIVLQTKSEVDILNDGYKWRKYGQKVVKGKSHPRSYYKCSNAGCTVRKHVERASTDPETVVTTYEGKHNHDVPAARKSSHNTANSNTLLVKPLAETGFGNEDQRPILLQLKE